MNKVAILSDIHGNLEALQAVLRDASDQKVDGIVCLGDIVGYNADPVACLNLIQECKCLAVVRGNHDHVCSLEESLEDFHPLARQVIEWTREQLSPEQRAHLSRLPYKAMLHSFTLVHSTLDMPDRWGYVFDKFQADANFAYQSTPVCFFGHTHVPMAFEKFDVIRAGAFTTIKVSIGHRYFINVGSVGQPRDGDPRAAYALYDLAAGMIHLQRVEYDIARTQKKIQDAGLPYRLAARLSQGR